MSNPFSECYVTSMSSQDIENMIYYCADNFAECDVYLNYRPSLQAPEGANRNFLTGPSQDLPKHRFHPGSEPAELP